MDEFKRFVNEFGTHYSGTSDMGTKLSIERRYSGRERAMADQNEISDCNTLVGAEVFGFQMEQNLGNCTNTDLKSKDSVSSILERTVISTHGSFIGSM